MVSRADRVVRQLQLRLLGGGSAVNPEASLASQVSEMADRIARLRRLGSQYASVRLSPHVDCLRQASVVEGRGGLSVTTEV